MSSRVVGKSFWVENIFDDDLIGKNPWRKSKMHNSPTVIQYWMKIKLGLSIFICHFEKQCFAYLLIIQRYRLVVVQCIFLKLAYNPREGLEWNDFNNTVKVLCSY